MIKPLQIAFAVISRSGNCMPIHDERITLFRDPHFAHKACVPGDRISRVLVFEDDPRIIVDALQKASAPAPELLAGCKFALKFIRGITRANATPAEAEVIDVLEKVINEAEAQ